MYERKKQELENLKEQASKGEIDVCYFDESGFNLTPNLPYAWSEIGTTLSIPAKMGKNLNVLGFLNVNSQNIFASTTSDKVDSEVVIKHFDLFAKKITKPTTVVLDNASIHTSIKFKERSHLQIQSTPSS